MIGFLNKNCYRHYPFRGGSSLVSKSGRKLSNALVAAMKISTGYDFTSVFLSRASKKGTAVSLTISAMTSTGIRAIGAFNYQHTSNFQNVTMQPFDNISGGTMVAGLVDDWEDELEFDMADALVEDSQVMFCDRPGIEAIRVKNHRLTGVVTITGTNVAVDNNNGHIIKTSVINRGMVLADDESGVKSGCGFKVIRWVNSVSPDDSGNVDIYAIDPVTVNVVRQGLVRLDSPSYELAELCVSTNPNLPPAELPDCAKYHDIWPMDHYPDWPQTTVAEYLRLWPAYRNFASDAPQPCPSGPGEPTYCM